MKRGAPPLPPTPAIPPGSASLTVGPGPPPPEEPESARPIPSSEPGLDDLPSATSRTADSNSAVTGAASVLIGAGGAIWDKSPGASDKSAFCSCDSDGEAASATTLEEASNRGESPFACKREGRFGRTEETGGAGTAAGGPIELPLDVDAIESPESNETSSTTKASSFLPVRSASEKSPSRRIA